MSADDPALIGGVGTWRLVSGSTGYTVDDINSPTAVFSNLSNGTYVFEWDLSFGDCPSTSVADQVTIEIGVDPTPAVITSPLTSVCGNNTVLTAEMLQNVNEVGVWSLIAGPNTPTIDNPGNTTINVSNLVTGQYTFRWTTISSSSLCENNFDEITFEAYKPIVSGDFNDINLCEVSSVFLEATSGTTGSWTLTEVNGITPSAAELATSSPSQVPSNSNTANASVSSGNNYLYTYTTSYPGCTVQVENVLVTVSEPMELPNAGLDMELCLDDPTTGANTSLSLSASNTATPTNVDTITWEVVSQPTGAAATFGTPNTLNTTLDNLTVAGLYVIELNFANAVCGIGQSDVLRVNVFGEPTPINAGSDTASACQLDYQTNALTPGVGINHQEEHQQQLIIQITLLLDYQILK